MSCMTGTSTLSSSNTMIRNKIISMSIVKVALGSCGQGEQRTSDKQGMRTYPFNQLAPGILPKIPNKNVADIEDTVDTHDTAVEREGLVNCHRQKLKNCCDVLFTKFIITYQSTYLQCGTKFVVIPSV